jgi:hypothetical protein
VRRTVSARAARRRGTASGFELALVVSVALLYGLFYAVALPPWDIHDEEQHLAYALTLRDEHRIPRIDEPLRQDVADAAIASDRWSAFRIGRPDTSSVGVMGLEGRSYEGFQPPLYYALLALLTRLTGDDPVRALFLARAAGAVLLAAFGAIAWALARAWFPESRSLGPLGAGLTAVAIPSAATASARVSNDLLAAVLVAGGILVLARWLERPRASLAILVGVLGAGAIVAKSSGLILLPVVLAALVTRRSSPGIVGQRIAMLAPAAVAALALVAWNEARYGVPDGTAAYLERYGAWAPLSFAHFWKAFWLTSWSDYWGAYGVGTLLVVTNVALLGIVGGSALGLARRPPSTALLLTGALAVTILLAVTYANHIAIDRPGGRFLLPLYPALAALIVGGWARLMSRGAVFPAAATWLLSLAYAVLWFLPFFHPTL